MRVLLPSCIGAALLGVIGLSAPAVARSSLPAAPQAMTANVAAPDLAAQIISLREELMSAQQEIVRLRALAANQNDLETALKVARERNERLVAITNDLIAAYAQRYRHGHYAPFDNGRRKFEEELQAVGDSAYDNRWDAGPRRAQSAAAPKADQSSQGKRAKTSDKPSKAPKPDAQ
jgi:hypothetical protein